MTRTGVQIDLRDQCPRILTSQQRDVRLDLPGPDRRGRVAVVRAGLLHDAKTLHAGRDVMWQRDHDNSGRPTDARAIHRLRQHVNPWLLPVGGSTKLRHVRQVRKQRVGQHRRRHSLDVRGADVIDPRGRRRPARDQRGIDRIVRPQYRICGGATDRPVPARAIATIRRGASMPEYRWPGRAA